MLHTMMRFLGSECVSISIKEGEVASQIPQIISWIREQMGMTQLEALDTRKCFIILDFMALNARIMVIVLTRTAIVTQPQM